MNARLVAPAVVLAALVAGAACARKEAACSVDTDCVQGSFCRSGLCAAVTASDDGGAEGGGPVECASPGSSCTTDNDCCSPPCNSSGRCAGGSSGTSGRSSSGTSGASGTSGTGSTSSGGNCQDLYGLCSFDRECCTGLSCDPNGTCR